MAKEKVKKNYKVEIKDGRITLTMNEKRDGKQISASCEYPLYIKNGATTKRQTKSQTEKYLLSTLGYAA